MSAWSRAKTPDAYRSLPLEAHGLLDAVPLHDVWTLDLEGADDGVSVEDVRALMNQVLEAGASGPVRFLFGLRQTLGRLFGWDATETAPRSPRLLERVPEELVSASLVAPGTREGPFQVVYVRPREAVSEIENATVLAYSVVALEPIAGGQRVHWAVHVAPVGRITAFYMALIDPFRRFIVYPTILKRVHDAWQRR